MKHIMKCVECGKYTMNEKCCNVNTIKAGPPKFSPEDSYAEYRRKAKMEQFKECGLI